MPVRFLYGSGRMNENRMMKDKSMFAGSRLNQKGFTLIELMVVIVILSILAVYMAPKIMGQPEKAKQAKARVDMQALETALKMYKLDNGHYPTTSQGLQALVEAPTSGASAKNWREGGYLDKSKLSKDPWGNDYVYLCPGVHGDYDIISYGADGEPGGEGDNKDITSWGDE